MLVRLNAVWVNEGDEENLSKMISTTKLTSVKSNLSWTTQQPTLLQICLKYYISQMSEQLF